jgi:hypothetical protein
VKPKLTPSKVKDIKLMLIFSGLKVCEIARYHNITPGQVSQIKLGDIWGYVDID